MIKTYKLTNNVRNSSFVLRGKTNNAQRFNFSGGDPLTGKAATLTLQSKYSQDLLESSDLFKQGYVKIVRTDNGGENVQQPEPQKTIVEAVDTPEALLEFVGVQLEKPYKQPSAALAYAQSKGYEFPNLDLKKE